MYKGAARVASLDVSSFPGLNPPQQQKQQQQQQQQEQQQSPCLQVSLSLCVSVSVLTLLLLKESVEILDLFFCVFFIYFSSIYFIDVYIHLLCMRREQLIGSVCIWVYEAVADSSPRHETNAPAYKP